MVLTAVGRDRIGIVSEVADLLYKLGCNLLDSSMTLLRGEFAIILMVRLPEGETIVDLERKLAAVEDQIGLNIHVRELSEDEMAESVASGSLHMISVYGADRPGIVAGVTRRLAEMGVNITDVETKWTNEGPETIFVMILEATVPANVPTRAVESALAQVSEELGVDVSVQAVEVYEL
jgi:glycine cleavage system transcriptional repressor